MHGYSCSDFTKFQFSFHDYQFIISQASYSGLFSAGASFSLDKEQQEAASNFSKMVETSTITVGAAPPSNGNNAFKANNKALFSRIYLKHNLFDTNK